MRTAPTTDFYFGMEGPIEGTDSSLKGVVPAGRVALVHDWLTGMRGGEMVLHELCLLFPEADLFTLVHIPGSVSPVIEKRRIIESPITRLPWGRCRFRSYLPLFPWAVEAFDLKGYDLVVSSSHCAAKGVIPPPDALNIAYIHTPMRYVWDIRTDYLGPGQLKAPARVAAGFAAHYLRNWDVASSSRVDRFIANSRHVQSRIMKYYRRESTVIYPPVAVDRFSVGNGGDGYYLTVSALVPYKRVDIAIAACNRLGVRLVVTGDGPELPRLKRMAGRTVEFVGPQPLEGLVELYRNADALIHPGEEDFGICIVEAQASGRPVIAYKRGGALETIIPDGDQRTGVFFQEQTPEALSEVLRDFDPGRFNPAATRRNAERFRRERFVQEMTRFIKDAWQEVK